MNGKKNKQHLCIIRSVNVQNIKIELYVSLIHAFTNARIVSNTHLNLVLRVSFHSISFFRLRYSEMLALTNRILWLMTFNLICTLKSENKFTVQIPNDTWKCRSFDLFFSSLRRELFTATNDAIACVLMSHGDMWYFGYIEMSMDGFVTIYWYTTDACTRLRSMLQ